MATYIEHDFPIEVLNAIAEKEGNAKKPIYQIHKWWARRLGSIFRMLILAAFTPWDDALSREENEKRLWERFYSKNELKNSDGQTPIILDPFMGGGTTIVEALRLGCKVIGLDLNPVAWFVTKKSVDPIDFAALDAVFKHLEQSVAPRIKHYYRTTCPKGHEADVMYVFWVKKVPCLACGAEVRLFPSFRIATRKGTHTVFCPKCYDIMEDSKSLGEEWECLECLTSFVPEKGHAGRGKYTCPQCGQRENILEAVRRQEAPPQAEMFALEYYCRICGRGYKTASTTDIALYEAARAEFLRLEDGLPFPRTKIPTEGRSDPRPINHGYKHFYQMFNERQLLCLSLLLEEILKIEDENTREYLLLTLSHCIDYNNMFCGYDYTRFHTHNLFAMHAYRNTNLPVEGNVWGARLGRSTFAKTFAQTIRAKRYAITPYERESVFSPTRKSIGDTSVGIVAENLHDGADAALRAATAEDLSFLGHLVDAVITDPPYCDNVMYAELADFFYVWLRLGLKDRYPQYFGSELSPRARELVKNQAQGKDEDFFFQGLTRCFQECYRVLKDDGLFIFTFHHAQPWAWKAVLKSLVEEADFHIEAIYPVHSEMRTSAHLVNTGGIGYDIPFVCRKRQEMGRPAAWGNLKDEIYFRAQETIEGIRRAGRRISDADIFVIAMGRCLAVYSRHWPNVMSGGQPVGVEQAVDEIELLVDSLVKAYELKLLPPGLDEPTQLYILYVAGVRNLAWDDLRKRFTIGGASLDDFNRRRYLEERQGRRLVPTPPEKRLELIEREMERGRPIPLIDIVHYLYAILKSEMDIRPELERWGTSGLVEVLDLLGKKTGDKTYDQLREDAENVVAGQRMLL